MMRRGLRDLFCLINIVGCALALYAIGGCTKQVPRMGKDTSPSYGAENFLQLWPQGKQVATWEETSPSGRKGVRRTVTLLELRGQFRWVAVVNDWMKDVGDKKSGEARLVKSMAYVADELILTTLPKPKVSDIRRAVEESGAKVVRQFPHGGVWLIRIPDPKIRGSLKETQRKLLTRRDLFSAVSRNWIARIDQGPPLVTRDRLKSLPWEELGFVDSDYALNRISLIDEAPNDPYFGDAWGLNNVGQEVGYLGLGLATSPGKPGADIDAMRAWQVQAEGSPDVVVAVLDTGVNIDHEDLRDQIWVNEAEAVGEAGVDDDGNGYVDDIHGLDVTQDPPVSASLDRNGHGTAVAGIIGAKRNNGRGSVGVAAGVRIMPLRGTPIDTIPAINSIVLFDYAREMGADIINASFGIIFNDEDIGAIQQAVGRLQEAGVLLVISAGNGGKDDKPINIDDAISEENITSNANVIVVAATDHHDRLIQRDLPEWSWSSNFGEETVDLGAPGEHMPAPWTEGGYRWFNGTSCAAPMVAGAAALVWSRYRQLDFRKVKQLILEGVDPVPDLEGKIATGGRLNVYRSLIPDVDPDRIPPYLLPGGDLLPTLDAPVITSPMQNERDVREVAVRWGEYLGRDDLRWEIEFFADPNLWETIEHETPIVRFLLDAAEVQETGGFRCPFYFPRSEFLVRVRALNGESSLPASYWSEVVKFTGTDDLGFEAPQGVGIVSVLDEMLGVDLSSEPISRELVELDEIEHWPPVNDSRPLFRWLPVEGAFNYRVDLEGETAVGDYSRTFQATGGESFRSPDQLVQGIYTITVRAKALLSRGPDGPASEPFRFEVTFLQPLSAPQDLQALSRGEGLFELLWDQVNTATGYEVELHLVRGVSHPIFRQLTDTVFVQVELMPGHYAFRVRALDSSTNREGPWSEWEGFEVID